MMHMARDGGCTAAQPLHFVQVGYDASVFASDTASDTLKRQVLYSDMLEALRAGSRHTYLATGAPAGAGAFTIGSTHIAGLPHGGVRTALGYYLRGAKPAM